MDLKKCDFCMDLKKETRPCAVCDLEACGDCRRKNFMECPGCEEIFCDKCGDDCLEDCEVCGEYFCEHCLSETDVYDRICKRCKAEQETA